jgi:Asp-tRNA(Asn)/Glu-tRNA(Gln) amidotransferase A subunit family amidase
MDKIIHSSAKALAQAIRTEEISSEEVIEEYLQRIEDVNPKLNAIVQLHANEAREQARKADAALALGELKGPLHGVPITIKDNAETKGMISTSGTNVETQKNYEKIPGSIFPPRHHKKSIPFNQPLQLRKKSSHT